MVSSKLSELLCYVINENPFKLKVNHCLKFKSHKAIIQSFRFHCFYIKNKNIETFQ